MDRQKELLFHDGTSGFCRYDEETRKYTFVLRTAGNLESVFLVSGEKEYPMDAIAPEEEVVIADGDEESKEEHIQYIPTKLLKKYI